jgi:diguanylate cyclase (GGDEF)-like protein/PAS domain S-box-containing protein
MTSPAATILIVDDEATNRKLLVALLQPEGYLIMCAANGEQALSMIAEQAPDLILLDIMMPGMDGYQVAEILKANPQTSSIPIIMVTARIDRSSRLSGLKAGAEDFLAKPVDRAELWLRVRNLLRLKALGDFEKNHRAILEQQVQARTAQLQRFRSAMDATADAIFLLSRSTLCFVEVNATACTMLGYRRDELFSMGLADIGLVAPERMADECDAIVGGAGAGELIETGVLRKDGSLLQVEMHRQAQRFGADWIIVCVLRDITERQEVQQRLHYMAHYDALTGLPNRTLFFATLKNALDQAADSSAQLAILLIDVDQFKAVNDTLGHTIGDTLLCRIGDRLLQCAHGRDTVGRLGGDEFALILMLDKGPQDAILVAEKVREVLRTPFMLKGYEGSLTASVGIAVYPDDALDPDTLIKYADTAMHRAKRAGRDNYRFFTQQMNVEVRDRRNLEIALRRAIEQGEFVLYYQPKVQIKSGRVVGLEALLRWNRPGHGPVLPQEFIPILEETGLIVQVGSWIIASACKQIGLWMQSGIGPMQIAVNVSSRQFTEGEIDQDVIKALQASGIDADLLELELTESSLMDNTLRTMTILQSLKQHGVHISIDDFGTGYSSLAYLCRFPIDKLKIDITFIRDITTNPDDAALALAIIRMAHSLKLEVVAEGVETEAQLAYLRRHCCDQIQGYYFSAPLALPELEKMLRDGRCLPQLQETLEAGMPQTVLLVADDAQLTASLQRLLRQDGYQILCARSAAEGFDLLARHPVQVVLCEQRMPGMEGTLFLGRVKDLYTDTFRIILGAQTDMSSIMDAVNSGAIDRFYTKPWSNRVLHDNIRAAFRRYRLMHGLPIDPCEAGDMRLPY